MRESNVEDHFIERVAATGGLQRKVRYIGRVACPDRLVGWPNGRHGLVELKRPLGKARKDQEREHARLRAHGFRVDVLDTVEAVDRFVEEMSR